MCVEMYGWSGRVSRSGPLIRISDLLQLGVRMVLFLCSKLYSGGEVSRQGGVYSL